MLNILPTRKSSARTSFKLDPSDWAKLDHINAVMYMTHKHTIDVIIKSRSRFKPTIEHVEPSTNKKVRRSIVISDYALKILNLMTRTHGDRDTVISDLIRQYYALFSTEQKTIKKAMQIRLGRCVEQLSSSARELAKLSKELELLHMGSSTYNDFAHVSKNVIDVMVNDMNVYIKEL